MSQSLSESSFYLSYLSYFISLTMCSVLGIQSNPDRYLYFFSVFRICKEAVNYYFFLLLILSLSTVSAFWPFDWIFGKKVTGNVIDNTPVENSGKCMDSDGGVYSKSAGEVSYSSKDKKSKVKDECISSRSGQRNRVKEYYCDNGKINVTAINCVLGCKSGACISSCKDSDANVTYPDGKNIFVKSIADDRVDGVGSYYEDTCLLRNQTEPGNWQYVNVGSCEGEHCIIQEGFCNNGKVSNLAYSCPQGTICSKGACLDKISIADSCAQKNFSMAVIILARDKSEITPSLLSNIDLIKNKFSDSFSIASKGFASINTSYPVSIFINKGFDPASWTSPDYNIEASRKFYEQNPDHFDFLVIYQAFEIPPEYKNEIAQYNFGIRNYISGIGSSISDDNYDTGSKEKLKSIINAGDNSPLAIEPLSLYSYDFNASQNLLFHEIGHTWGVYVGDNFNGNKNNAKLEIKMGGIHFYNGLNNPSYSSDALGSEHWIPNGDGTFRRTAEEQGNTIGNFHPFMLYFMGLIPESQYDINHTIYDAGIPENNFNPARARPYKNISINDIISVEGPRECFKMNLASIKSCIKGVYIEKQPYTQKQSVEIAILSKNDRSCFTRFTITASDNKNVEGLYMNCEIPLNILERKALIAVNMRYYGRSGYCKGTLLDQI